jgi:hypothetical protein
MWEAHYLMPKQIASGVSRCFRGAGTIVEPTDDHVAAAHAIRTMKLVEPSL